MNNWMEQKIKQNLPLGAHIRALRIKRGLTQEQMTARLQLHGCDLTRGSYAKIEAGIQHISASQLLAVADVLQTSIDALFGRSS